MTTFRTLHPRRTPSLRPTRGKAHRQGMAIGLIAIAAVLSALAPPVAALPASALPALAGDADCPLALEPYSIDTPLMDLLLNQAASAILREDGLLRNVPPGALGTTPPNFSAIISPRLLARAAGRSPESLITLDETLRAVALVSADIIARCARYDPSTETIVRPPSRPALLIFEKITGFRDAPSVQAARESVEAIARRRGWSVVTVDTGAAIAADTLEAFDAVFWNNISGDVLTVPQRAALRAYLENGGGFAAVHGSAGDPVYVWDWYADDLIGARFLGHPQQPQFQAARIVVTGSSDPITAGLPAEFGLTDEWYSFKASPRVRGVRVLATLDEASYDADEPGRDLRMGDHPIAWVRCVGQGRAFYSAIGHRPQVYADPNAARLLENGLAFAMGVEPSSCAP